MILGELFLGIIWWYTSWNNRLTDLNLNQKQRRRQFVNPLVTALVFVLSIGIAFAFTDLAKLSWLLILPVDDCYRGEMTWPSH